MVKGQAISRNNTMGAFEAMAVLYYSNNISLNTLRTYLFFPNSLRHLVNEERRSYSLRRDE